MSRAHTKANDILWASTFVKFLFSIITFAGIAVTVNILSDNREIISAAYIGALAVIFFFLGDIFVTVFISFEKMGYASVFLLSFRYPPIFYLPFYSSALISG